MPLSKYKYSAKLSAIIAFIAIFVTSCREVENVAYSDFVAFGTEGWDPLYVIDFSPFPVDSVLEHGEKFDIILTLRYSPKHLAQQIPIEVTEEDEGGVIGTSRISVSLCDADGKPKGKRGIALYEISDTLKRDFVLPEGYMLSLSSLSPSSNTLCLRNLGITLKRTRRFKSI